MNAIADNSVQEVITSPPYWNLKDYGSNDQIGFHDTYEEYVNNLNVVWAECYRILEPQCRLCVNIGDQFARAMDYGRYKVIPIRTEIIKFCEAIGFDFMGNIIWQKVTTTKTTGGASVMGSYLYPRNGIVTINYEYILLFKKRGKNRRKINADVKEASKMSPQEWYTYFSGHWQIQGIKQDKHHAMFPLEIPRRLIKMFSFVGETILDPFVGSGTSIRAAYETDRNSIGYEINPAYEKVIREKLTDSDNIQILKQEANEYDNNEKIRLLPYRFIDLVGISKKVPSKRSCVGSNTQK